MRHAQFQQGLVDALCASVVFGKTLGRTDKLILVGFFHRLSLLFLAFRVLLFWRRLFHALSIFLRAQHVFFDQLIHGACGNLSCFLAATWRSCPEGSAGASAALLDLCHFFKGGLWVVFNFTDIDRNFAAHGIAFTVWACLIGKAGSACMPAAAFMWACSWLRTSLSRLFSSRSTFAIAFAL